MLNGLDPIIIFQFSKLTPAQSASLAKIPIVSSIVSSIGLPPIPIYLSETLTGLFIDTEEKNVDIETQTDTLTDGSAPQVQQKGVNSTIKVTLKANKDSIGLTLLSAMVDIIFSKVTSKEYSIIYLHGPITVFNGLLHSFSVSQNADTDIEDITFEIDNIGVPAKTPVPVVSKVTGSVPL